MIGKMTQNRIDYNHEKWLERMRRMAGLDDRGRIWSATLDIEEEKRMEGIITYRK